MRAYEFILKESNLAPGELFKADRPGRTERFLEKLLKKEPFETREAQADDKSKKRFFTIQNITWGPQYSFDMDNEQDTEELEEIWGIWSDDATQRPSGNLKFTGFFNDSPEELVTVGGGKLAKTADFKGGHSDINYGDIGEGITALVIAAKFQKRDLEGDVAPEDFEKLLKEARKHKKYIKGKTAGSFIGISNFEVISKVDPDIDPPGAKDDIIKLFVSLPKNSFDGLLSESDDIMQDKKAINITNAAINYVNNSNSLKTYIAQIVRNPEVDSVFIKMIGTAGDKVDLDIYIDGVEADIDNKIRLSLKSGSSVKQFGQIGGSSIDAIKLFFKKLINYELPEDLVPKGETVDTTEFLKEIYRRVADMINAQFQAGDDEQELETQVKAIENIAMGIRGFATGGEEGIHLLHLGSTKAGLFKILRFNDLDERLKMLMRKREIHLQARFKVGGGKLKLPIVNIVDEKTGKILITFRSKGENKTEAKTGKEYIYYRNYVELGPLLEDLTMFEKLEILKPVVSKKKVKARAKKKR